MIRLWDFAAHPVPRRCSAVSLPAYTFHSSQANANRSPQLLIMFSNGLEGDGGYKYTRRL